MSKHTPGPWRANIGKAIGSGCYCTVTTIPPGPATMPSKKVLELPYGSNHDPEDVANARLIAAAPELLEALVTCIEMLRECNRNGCNPGQAGSLRDAVNAVKKATGETSA